MGYPITRISPTTSGRERTPDLWRNLLDRYESDPLLGTLRSEDFQNKNVNNALAVEKDGWLVAEDGLTGATSEELNSTESADGRATLSAATGTDHMGVKCSVSTSVTVCEGVVLPTHASEAKGDVVFEAIVAVSTLNPTLFVGLAAAMAQLHGNTSLLVDLDYIGFNRLDDGDLQFVANTAAGTTTAIDVLASADVPASGDIKLGFRVNASGSVEVFIDGVRVKKTTDTGVSVAVPTTSQPVDYLCRTVAAIRGATADNATSVVDIDKIEVYVSE